VENRDQRLINLIDGTVQRGAASEEETLVGMVYGNLKLEDPQLERETVTTAVRLVLKQRPLVSG
jgi:hypothetical protein